jgi:hypothetical protein
MVGYQIEVDSSTRAWSGGLYEQGRRGWLQNLATNEPARKAFKPGEWNHYRIVCVGDSIRTWVNGVAAADYRDSMDLEGVIALQVHSGRNVRVAWRNIRIQDLGRHLWKPLWDGQSFSGWHEIGKGNWQLADSAIRGTQKKEVADYGHLVSDSIFTNFTVRFEFKSMEGNSGFYFRAGKGGSSGINGFQAEVDPEQDVGGLYETGGRGWVVKPSAELVQKAFHPKQWNLMSISAHEERIAVDVNGTRTAEILENAGRKSGHFALQVHGGQDVEVLFRKVEILVPENQPVSRLK